ncbi:hypothetical protein QUF64_02220 [Anaerolineales bacterium HSG6]|nr:hypothetical protein [Anaerolineales bacterium HSG6]
MTTILTTLLKKIDYDVLLACIIPLFAIIPMLSYAGLPNSADGPIHLIRQVEFNQAWQEGNYYPRWGTDLALGHGMPIFSYAPPSLYFLTQFFHLLGLTLDEAMKSVVIFDFILYSLGMFLLVRPVFGAYPALMAATVHVYAPYRLREAYIQGNYGQFTGLACYAFICWGFYGVVIDGRPRYTIFAAISLAGLLLSHNISAMNFAPLLAAYLIFLLLLQLWQNRLTVNQTDTSSQLWRHVSLYAFARTVIAGLLGMGLAAIFWIPAFVERHDIKLEGITQDFFDFRENFISLSDLLSPPMALDLTAINPTFPFSIGFPQLIGTGLGMLAVGWLFWRQYTHLPEPSSPLAFRLARLFGFAPFAHTLFFALWTLIYSFLTIPPSQLIWENVPLLELTEFPWRMLGPALFCASFLAAPAFTMLNNFFSRMARRQFPQTIPSSPQLLLIIGLFSTIALNLHYLYPVQFIEWNTPTPKDVFQYEINTGAIGTTSTGEFLPRYAQQHPQPDTLWPDYQAGQLPQRLDPATIPAQATVETVYHRSESEMFRIDTPEPFMTTLRMLYWPGWQIYLDGQPADFRITEPTGLVELTIPAGEHTLSTQLENTPIRQWGKCLSIIALVILIYYFGRMFYLSSLNIRSKPEIPTNEKDGILLTLESRRISLQYFTITTLLLFSMYLLTRPLFPLFSLQSDPNHPQLADQVLQADFADQIRLVGMDDLPMFQLNTNADTTMTVTLYWRALLDLDTNYAVFIHLDGPNGQTYATADEPNPEFIPSRNWPTGLYLRNPIHLHVPADLPPIRYDVTVGVYNPETGDRLLLADGQTAFKIDELWLTESLPDLPAKPLARFGAHVVLWQVTVDEAVHLYWQTEAPLTDNLSIFLHALDENGAMLSQVDGVPYQGLYPLPHWLPHQPLIDTRPLEQIDRVHSLAIGIYDPLTSERLPVLDVDGNSVPDGRLVIPVP